MKKLLIPTPPLASPSRFWRSCRAGIFALALTAAFTGRLFAQNAIFTTDGSGNPPVNKNIYAYGTDVYLNGGPVNANAHLGEGDYYFQVTSPSGNTLLSSDCAACRIVHVDAAGIMTYTPGPECATPHNSTVVSGNTLVQLYPFSQTPNAGGEYKVELVKVTDGGVTVSGDGCSISLNGHADVKSDNFRIGLALCPECPCVGPDCPPPCVGDECPPEGCVTTCPEPIVVECGSGQSTDPTLDNSPASTCALTYGDSGQTAGCGGSYTFTRTWYYSDDSVACVQTVTVQDTTAPVLSGGSVTAATTCGPSITAPTVTDCDPNASLNTPTDTITPKPGTGTYTFQRCWTATDACGYTTSPAYCLSADVKECKVTGGLTIGYWQNSNGQGKINGANQSDLCTYLKSFAPFSDVTSPIKTYVYNVVKAANASGTSMNPMLKAQMLATALGVYFSGPGRPLGNVHIDLTYINKPPFSSSYENTLGAFGGVNNCKTINELLTCAASKSNNGGTTWYGQVKATQELAKDTFDAINNNVAVVCP